MGKHPIIAKGEYYVEPLIKRIFAGTPSFPHEYEEAKVRLQKDIENIQELVQQSNEFFIDEKIVCVRLEPKYEAKSYTPSSLLADTNMRLVGGRKYRKDLDSGKAKLYFMRASDEELNTLKLNLGTSRKDHVKSWRNQICTISTIDLLRPDEKVMGFDDDWKDGKVEIILHPLGNHSKKAIDSFFSITGLAREKTVVRQYEDGLTFVCATVDKRIIDKIKYYNPLRSIKPINDNLEDNFRMSPFTIKGPKLPDVISKSDIKIGVFDGGVEEGTYLVDPFCVKHDMVPTLANEKFLEHGSAVCGAVLFGCLNGLSEHDEVELPSVQVESFRVFPALKTGNGENDYQMYGTIDIIEKIVRERKDIKVFNLSIGPKGAILDDELNRFTYVCDRLSYDVDEDEPNPLFCVAVGNDGNLDEPLNRVQAPSDMVNGLAVGAYSYNSINDKTRANYSCVGPGREGAKTKPDILDFGGSNERPFIGAMHGTDLMGAVMGTSFAAPTAAGKIGKLMARSQFITPHLGRTLLIQNAEATDGSNRTELGFGFCPESIDEILECTDNHITIMYSGEIASSTSVKLPIFMPEVSTCSGNAKIGWTISTVVNPNANDPDAYTNNCIEDTFYPHDMTFNFTKKGFKTKKLNLALTGKVEEAIQLMNQGYNKSELPVSKPAKKYFREEDLRNSDFKWDTIIKKNVSLRNSSLLNPFITLHAIGRDEYQHEKIRYNVVVTIDVPSYPGSLYDKILERYSNLTPITIRNIERVKAII